MTGEPLRDPRRLTLGASIPKGTLLGMVGDGRRPFKFSMPLSLPPGTLFEVMEHSPPRGDFVSVMPTTTHDGWVRPRALSKDRFFIVDGDRVPLTPPAPSEDES